MRKHFLPILFLLLAMPAYAQDRDPGAVKPVEIAPVIHALSPYGTGTYSYFGITVYDAALWTDAPTWSMKNIFALSLVYSMDISQQEFVDGSLDEMNKEQPLSEQEGASYRPILASLLPSVVSGDRMTALYTPGKGLQVYHNGQLTGSTDNIVFAKRFMNIWVSKKSSAPDLRHQLLKQD